MMMNIFSNFDPMWFMLCYKNSMIIVPILMVLNMFWLNYSKLNMMSFPVMNYMITQLKSTKLLYLKNMFIIMTILFIFIIFMNIMGMVPYLFSPTMHIMFTLSLGLPMWMSLIMSSLKFKTKNTMAHLLPNSTPTWLSPFLVLIQSISTTVRPMTLSFRLAANMTAGHVVLNLISVLSVSVKMNMFFSIMLMSMMYIMFELAICMIQAYIFCLLISLYTNDHA